MTINPSLIEQGLQFLSERRQACGAPPLITDADRNAIAEQLRLADGMWTEIRRRLVGHPELLPPLELLWAASVPEYIKGSDVSPVHHTVCVTQFMAEIGLAELSLDDLRRGLYAALLHDIGIGDCRLPKIGEHILKAAPPEQLDQLRRDGIRSRLEHMELGAVIAARLLAECRTRFPDQISPEDIAVVVDLIATHDNSKIPLMDGIADRKWLLSPEPADWLRQCHWEADALWMLSAPGILVDLQRQQIAATPAACQAMFAFNLSLHGQIVTLYEQAFTPAEFARFHFQDGLLYRSKTGSNIARRLAAENAAL